MKHNHLTVDVTNTLERISEVLYRFTQSHFNLFEKQYNLYPLTNGKPLFDIGKEYILIKGDKSHAFRAVFDGTDTCLAKFITCFVYESIEATAPIYNPLSKVPYQTSMPWHEKAPRLFRELINLLMERFAVKNICGEVSEPLLAIIVEFFPTFKEELAQLDLVQLENHPLYLAIHNFYSEIENTYIDETQVFVEGHYYTIDVISNFLSIKHEGSIEELEYKELVRRVREEKNIKENDNFSLLKELYGVDIISLLRIK